MRIKQIVIGAVAGLVLGIALTHVPTGAADVPAAQADRAEYDMEGAGNGGVYAISRRTGRVFLFERTVMTYVGNVRDFDARENLPRNAIDGREAR
jgi:hypothetical protein